MIVPRRSASSKAITGAAWKHVASVLVLVGALGAGEARAHDASAWGGLFRSYDGGATWQHLTPASFGSGAMALAVSPTDPHHLLLATDSGVSRSRNGGRDWNLEAPETLIGPAFAVAFDVDGERALVSGPSAIFRTDGGPWRRLKTPAGSAPARALVSGGVRGRAYLIGRTGLLRTDDWGEAWVSIGDRFRADPVRAVLVDPGRADAIHIVAGGLLWRSTDGGRSWPSRDEGLDAVETVSVDPAAARRRWAVGRGQVFQTDDEGRRWRPVGKALPESSIAARGVAVSGRVILVATDRGLYRSPDDGVRWEMSGDNLPAHLEAGVLVRDPSRPTTLYAGFALLPADELARRAASAGHPFGRLDLTNLVGSVVFLAVIVLGAGAALRRLATTYYRRPQERSLSRVAAERSPGSGGGKR